MTHSPPDPFPRIAVPSDVSEALVYWAMMAASHESLKPAWRPSRIPGPDGRSQPETTQEFITRVVTAGVLHLIEIGLLVVPDDLAVRLDGYYPMSRDDGLPGVPVTGNRGTRRGRRGVAWPLPDRGR